MELVEGLIIIPANSVMLQGMLFLGWMLGFCLSWIPLLKLWCPYRGLESGLILGCLIWLGALAPLGYWLDLNLGAILICYGMLLGALGWGIWIGTRLKSSPGLYRAGLHLIAGCILAGIGAWDLKLGIQICSAGFCLCLLAELIRIWKFPGQLGEFISARFQPGLRSQEQKLYLGSIAFMLGALCSLTLFGSVIPILVISICDPMASWIGQNWGRHRILRFKLGEKSLAGSLGFWISCWGILGAAGIPILDSGIIALGCCLAELVPKLDNLSVPLCCGIMIRALS